MDVEIEEHRRRVVEPSPLAGFDRASANVPVAGELNESWPSSRD